MQGKQSPDGMDKKTAKRAEEQEKIPQNKKNTVAHLEHKGDVYDISLKKHPTAQGKTD